MAGSLTLVYLVNPIIKFVPSLRHFFSTFRSPGRLQHQTVFTAFGCRNNRCFKEENRNPCLKVTNCYECNKECWNCEGRIAAISLEVWARSCEAITARKLRFNLKLDAEETMRRVGRGGGLGGCDLVRAWILRMRTVNTGTPKTGKKAKEACEFADFRHGMVEIFAVTVCCCIGWFATDVSG
jgi:hypothetical protein